MSGCSGNDRRQMWREFLCRRPLIESCVGTAPHCNLAIAKRSLGKPLDDVVAVMRVVCKWFELAAGVCACRPFRPAIPIAKRRYRETMQRALNAFVIPALKRNCAGKQ